MKKIIAIFTVMSFFLCITGCATLCGGKKIEFEANEFENTVGVSLVLAGMAAGAYEGSNLSNGSVGQNLSYGVLGGLAGAAVTGLVYLGFLFVTGGIAIVDDNQDDTLKADPDVLMPKE